MVAKPNRGDDDGRADEYVCDAERQAVHETWVVARTR
jgi:hypothetical protein